VESPPALWREYIGLRAGSAGRARNGAAEMLNVFAETAKRIATAEGEKEQQGEHGQQRFLEHADFLPTNGDGVKQRNRQGSSVLKLI
jgi:hypothetical protein